MATVKQQPSAKSLEQIRTNARRRLIGAIVLVVLAIAILPWVLESKPRDEVNQTPINTTRPTGQVEVPVQIPPTALTPPVVEEVPVYVTPIETQTPEAPPTTSTIEPYDPYEPIFSTPTGNEVPGTQTSASTPVPATTSNGYATRPANRAEIPSKVRVRDGVVQTAAATTGPSKVTTPNNSANRAAELLGENPATVVRGGTRTAAVTPNTVEANKQFVIQVGAYADPAKVSEVRARLTMGGFSSYTQEVETSAGKTTRVRVGPIIGRDAAEKIAEKFRGMGLPVSILPA